jgi:hypothetical protein
MVREGRDARGGKGKSSSRGGGGGDRGDRGEGGGALGVKNVNLPPMLPSINAGKVNAEMVNQAKKNVLVVDREKEFGARIGHTKQDMGGLLEYPEDQIAKKQKARTQALAKPRSPEKTENIQGKVPEQETTYQQYQNRKNLKSNIVFDDGLAEPVINGRGKNSRVSSAQNLKRLQKMNQMGPPENQNQNTGPTGQPPQVYPGVSPSKTAKNHVKHTPAPHEGPPSLHPQNPNPPMPS